MSGVNVNHPEFEDFVFQNAQVSDFKCELVTISDREILRLSVELRRGANAEAILSELVRGVKGTFEVTPELVLLETGTLAKEFESSVKAPRFTDSRK